MMAYRSAVIGCGKIGSGFADDPKVKSIYTHAGAYTACPETALVAVCSRDPSKAERCGERWKVPGRFTDARTLLAEGQPEIVSICTPDETHPGLIRMALGFPSVRAILTEKPLAVDLRVAEELVDRAKAEGVVLAVDYSRRYSARIQGMKDLIARGEIGAVQAVHGYYTGGVLHNGTHWFDLARLLVGEVALLQGIGSPGGDSPDPTLDTILEFRNGARGYLHGCDAGAFTIFEMDVVGTLGRVEIRNSGHTVILSRVRDSPYYTGYRALVQEERWEDGMQDVLLHAVEDVVRCVREGGEPRCSGHDGVEALRIGLAVRDSAKTGKPALPGGS